MNTKKHRPDLPVQNGDTLKKIFEEPGAIPVLPVTFPFVRQACELFEEKSVRICAVIGFPDGTAETCSKILEARESIKYGASELEITLNSSHIHADESQKIIGEITEIRREFPDIRIIFSAFDDQISGKIRSEAEVCCVKNNALFQIRFIDNKKEKTVDTGSGLEGKILHIQMSRLEIKISEPDGMFKNLWGRQLASELYRKYEADGEQSVVIAAGFLSGAGIPASAQLSIAACSPLTRSMRIPVIRGLFAEKFGLLGLRAIVITGSHELQNIHIDQTGVSFVSARPVKKLKTSDAQAFFQKEYENAGILFAPSSGEYGSKISTLFSSAVDGNLVMRLSRGYGFGSVLVSHGIKSIIIRQGIQGRKISESFSALTNHFRRFISEHTVTGRSLPAFSDSVFLEYAVNKGWINTKTTFDAGSFFKKLFSDNRNTNVSCSEFCPVSCIACFKEKKLPVSVDLKSLASFISAGITDDNEILRYFEAADEAGICRTELAALLSAAKTSEEMKNSFHSITADTFLSDNWEARILNSGCTAAAFIMNAGERCHENNDQWPWFTNTCITGTIAACLFPTGFDESAFPVIPDLMLEPSRFDTSAERAKERMIISVVLQQAGLCENILAAFNTDDLYEVLLAFIKKLTSHSVTKTAMVQSVRAYILNEGRYMTEKNRDVFPKTAPEKYLKFSGIEKIKRIRL